MIIFTCQKQIMFVSWIQCIGTYLVSDTMTLTMDVILTKVVLSTTCFLQLALLKINKDHMNDKTKINIFIIRNKARKKLQLLSKIFLFFYIYEETWFPCTIYMVLFNSMANRYAFVKYVMMTKDK